MDLPSDWGDLGAWHLAPRFPEGEASSKAQQHHGQGITFPIMLLGCADEVIE